ncbi:response regulator [Paenibacillus sp. J5C_2022]|uniref:response regulator n=1 Tax=Paenibacillus sp. J5C2022 TaxID=2977129 RepID=UPI0021D2F4E7|nr:response regulator [Paenibacillus sp. J5C2022]MCU6710378.1 response regulator [Paenibacillus sp. J5C2022]
MIRVVLIDDEESALDALQDELADYEYIVIAGKYTNPLHAMQMLRAEGTGIDIVFLDIEMPGMNGLQAAEEIMEAHSAIDIVFITAYDQYAIEAFEVNAIDYLLKPVMPERLAKTVRKWSHNRKRLTGSSVKEKRWVCELTCFGSFQLHHGSDGEKTIRWRTKKTKELFAYFIHHQGNAIHKSLIIRDIWPDIDEERALANIHTSVYYIRKMIKEFGLDRNLIVSYMNDCYKMMMKNAECDVNRYLMAAELDSDAMPNAIEHMEAALRLYRGDYLAMEGYAWAIPRQQKLRSIYKDMVANTTRCYEQSGRYSEAVALLREATDHQPELEELHALLLRMLRLSGDEAAVEEHYRHVETLLREEYGVEPGEAIASIYREH